MIRLWSAEAPLAWPNSNRSRPRTRAPGRRRRPVRGARAERAEADDDDVPVAAGSGHRAMVGGSVTQSRVRMTVCYRVRMNVRTNLMLPQELVEAIDEVAGPRGRSRYVADVLARQIRRDRWYAAAKATAGAWKDHPLFPHR